MARSSVSLTATLTFVALAMLALDPFSNDARMRRQPVTAVLLPPAVAPIDGATPVVRRALTSF